MTKLISTGIDSNGVEDFVGVDDSGRLILNRHCADVEPVLSQNKELANSGDGYTPSRDLQHVASIPIALVEVWKAQYGVDPTARGNEKLLCRLLNDHTNRFLRTGGGRLDFKERH